MNAKMLEFAKHSPNSAGEATPPPPVIKIKLKGSDKTGVITSMRHRGFDILDQDDVRQFADVVVTMDDHTEDSPHIRTYPLLHTALDDFEVLS